MIFGGVQKTSLIDYPGKISCVLFLFGCNFTCPYCHNPGLVRGDQPVPSFLNHKWVINFLKERVGFLDGVVITGGEPTLSKDLVSLCKEIKGLGYKIKLDTNGTKPDVIKSLIKDNLIDFLAMDVKTDPLSYAPVFSNGSVSKQILSSIKIILQSELPYEFRTTCVKPIIDQNVIKEISKQIKGAERFVLQQFQFTNLLNPQFFNKEQCAFTKEELAKLQAIASSFVHECIVR